MSNYQLPITNSAIAAIASVDAAPALLDLPQSKQEPSTLPLAPSRTAPTPPVAIMGVPFDNITTAEALQAIQEMIASGRPHYLVTANVDFLVQAHADVELRRILVEADLVLCDGTPLVWVSRLLGNALPERVAGADLAPLLIGLAARNGYRLFLLGATEDSCLAAVANLRRDYPELIIAGHYSPPFKPLLEMDHQEMKRRIQEAKPDLLLVSFGCPKQEKWITMHYRSLGVPVCAGVGATIDFLAGKMKRAPLWMRRSGVEWVFRLLQEPRRLFRRYAKDLFVFGRCVLRQWLFVQLRSEPDAWTGVSCVSSGARPSSGAASPEACNLPEHSLSRHGVRGALLDERTGLLDMSRVESLDSTGIGSLIRLRKQLLAAGKPLVLVAANEPVRQCLALMRLEEFLDFAPNEAAAQQLIADRVCEQSFTARVSGTDCQVPSGVASSPTPHAPRPCSLSWHGEVSAANADTVWEQTHTLILSLRSPELTIDLSGVRFIDSTGLGTMIRAKKLAQERGVSLTFSNLQPTARNVIHIARLETLLLQ